MSGLMLTDEDRETLVRRLHNEGDGGIWEHFDRANAEEVADGLVTAVEAIVARAVTAALNEAADEGCEHANVRTFRSIPPHSKCLDCGSVVEKRWTART